MERTGLEERLQAEIDAVVRDDRDVFSAVVRVDTGRHGFRWAGAAGRAYANRTEEMRVDTPIFVASITKTYVAAATLMLEERGLFTLEDPLSRFLPASMLASLHRYQGRDYSDQLSIYHLISQTSGLADYFTDRPRGGKSFFDRIVSGSDVAWDVETVVDVVKTSLSPRFPPEPKDKRRSGNKAYYSDTNYQLLGAVLESVAAKPLHELLEDLIIEPLGLSSTFLFGDGQPLRPLDRPPATIFYRQRALRLDNAMKSFGPDGGIVSTVTESLDFLKHLLEGRLFENPSTLQRMMSWRRIFFPFQYGLGLMRSKLPRIVSPFSATPELTGHSGSSGAFLFHCDLGPLYICGTLNQVENQGRPYRLLLKLSKMVGDLAF